MEEEKASSCVYCWDFHLLMEHMRTAVGFLVLWEAHFPQHGRMGEDAGFPARSCFFFFISFQSTSARSNEPFSMFALIFVCVLL